MSAHRGFDPSYLWRSLWGAKSLLLDGMRWRVGNGLRIAVWKDVWLPGEDGNTVPTSRIAADPEMCMADFIDHETGWWNVGRINMFFSAEDGPKVMDIPLSKFWPRDERYWWPNVDGCYSVKSGY